MRLNSGYRFAGLAAIAAAATVAAGSAFGATHVLAPSIASFKPTSAKVGAKVMIAGKNLTGATSVTLDGTRMTFKVVSAKSISVTIPTKAKSGKLIVTTKAGKATSKAKLTVS
jgi:hypothetical protein